MYSVTHKQILYKVRFLFLQVNLSVMINKRESTLLLYLQYVSGNTTTTCYFLFTEKKLFIFFSALIYHTLTGMSGEIVEYFINCWLEYINSILQNSMQQQLYLKILIERYEQLLSYISMAQILVPKMHHMKTFSNAFFYF